MTSKEQETIENLVEEFYSVFEGTKFEASWKKVKEIDGKAAPYFPNDWLRTTLTTFAAERDGECANIRPTAIGDCIKAVNEYMHEIQSIKSHLRPDVEDALEHVEWKLRILVTPLPPSDVTPPNHDIQE